jgi:hypothetical protein
LGLVHVSIKRASLDAPTRKNLPASMTDAPLAQTYRLNLAKRVWEIGGSSLESFPKPCVFPPSHPLRRWRTKSGCVGGLKT